MGNPSVVPHPQSESDALTHREKDILVLLAETQLSNQDIANRLFLSLNSIKWYARQIYLKLGAKGRKEAVARAIEIGLIGCPSTTSLLPFHPLPVQLTPFIGREKEIQDISKLLCDPTLRLLTFTGTGGVGKTRLALKVAEENQSLYLHNIQFIELAALSQGQLIPERIASSLGLHRNESRDQVATLVEFLQPLKLLLILDNCEHLINDCAILVEQILHNCPHLQILATSREILGIYGEVIYVVQPLEVPDLGKFSDNDQLVENEAVQFFLNRAVAVRPDFRINQQNKKAVLYICNHLDGIPLALELAAARLKVLEIDQIAGYLESNYQILSRGERMGPLRQKTMEASIEWSYNLLSAVEQRILQELAVFNGGWTLEAAQAVCGTTTTESISETEVIDYLSQLIDKSLIGMTYDHQIDLDQSEPFPYIHNRYRMLEPIRQYARKRLGQSGQEAEVFDRHLTYFVTLAETAEPIIRGPEQVEWVYRLEGEIDNLRLALAWALSTSAVLELRLGSALMWFWHIRGRWAEGLEWLQKGLQALSHLASTGAGEESALAHLKLDLVHARALCAAGFLQSNLLLQQDNSKDFDQVFTLFNQSLDIFQRQRPPDRRGMAFALMLLARSAKDQLDPAEVSSWANQSLSLNREEEDFFGISECLLILANNEKNPARAKEAFTEALKFKRKLKDIGGLAFALANASSLAIFEGDYHQAETYLVESLSYFRKVGNQSYIVQNLNHMAWVDWVKGDVKEALLHIDEAVAICEENGLSSSNAWNLLLHCEIFLSLGNLEEAKQDVLDAMEIGQYLGENAIIISACQHQGKVAWQQGCLLLAAQCLDKALSVSRVISAPLSAAGALSLKGRIAVSTGDLVTGKALFFESVRRYSGVNHWHDWVNLAYPLEGLATIALEEHQVQQATLLYAYACRLFPMLANTLSPGEKALRENDLSLLRTALGEAVFDQYWQSAAHSTVEQIIAYALNV